MAKRIVSIFLLCLIITCQAKQTERDLIEANTFGLQQSLIINNQPYLAFPSQQEGQQWLDQMSERLKPFIKDDFLRQRYLLIIQYEAFRAGLDPQLILSLITVESKFNPYAVGTSKEEGLMQVMQFWRKLSKNQELNLFDVRTNIRFGCTILALYLQLERGNLTKALARYNGSNGSVVYPNKIYKAYCKYWRYKDSTSISCNS